MSELALERGKRKERDREGAREIEREGVGKEEREKERARQPFMQCGLHWLCAFASLQALQIQL